MSALVAIVTGIGSGFALASPPGPTAFDHDHAAFAGILEGVVQERGVDYEALASQRAELGRYLDGLAEAPLAAFSKEEQLAVWVNAYNAHTLALVLDNPEISSIRDLDGGEVWKRRTFRVGGEDLTLDAMEHERARPLSDGRVHAVLSCAARGCPPLPPSPLRASTHERQLREAATVWVRTNAYKIRGDTLHLSQVFKWYAEDFEPYRREVRGADPEQAGAIGFIATFSPREDAARLTAGAYEVAWEPYDWELNRLPSVEVAR
ncbi:MAG: DUF547 domain-containing protein [Deltaproteobacteria bacterium]|nr:MAG: DUF547 domain-containing protein [Deltaproteobacteria bacterium]